MNTTPATVHIIGSGVDPIRHLTLEAIEALGACREIWTNVPVEIFGRLPGSLAPAVRSLKPFYRSDQPRRKNYADVTQHILARAAVLGSVGYFTQGHPIIFDSVATALHENGNRDGLTVNFVGGVSSIDTVLQDLRFDPGRGLQIFEATNFVRHQYKFDTRAALLLFQPSVFGSGMTRLTASSSPSDLRQLRDALLVHYPADHQATFVRSATSFNPPFMVTVAMGELHTVAPSVTLASSLFIAPRGELGARTTSGLSSELKQQDEQGRELKCL